MPHPKVPALYPQRVYGGRIYHHHLTNNMVVVFILHDARSIQADNTGSIIGRLLEVRSIRHSGQEHQK